MGLFYQRPLSDSVGWPSSSRFPAECGRRRLRVHGTHLRSRTCRDDRNGSLAAAGALGGAGERRTLRLVAEYADACNLFDIPGRWATLTRNSKYCNNIALMFRRQYEEIERTGTTAVNGDSVDSLNRSLQTADRWRQHVVLFHPWATVDRHRLPGCRDSCRSVSQGQLAVTSTRCRSGPISTRPSNTVVASARQSSSCPGATAAHSG